METWKETRERLGLPETGTAAEIVRRATAPARHEARIEATLAAVRSHLGDDAINPAAVVAELIADLNGVGGPFGAGMGAATWRRPWARALGSGRWQAADGWAYMAAAVEALHRSHQGSRVTVAPAGRRVAVVLSRWDEAAGGLAETSRAFVEDRDPSWADALARRGLLIAVGELITSANDPLDFLRWEGAVAEWAAVVDAEPSRPAVEPDTEPEPEEATW